MGLVTRAEYECELKIKDITPQLVLAMLRDVREEIAKLNPAFSNHSLDYVLKAIETGEYVTEERVPRKVDLSEAKRIVGTYRHYSEGGCQSCVSLRRDTINA